MKSMTISQYQLDAKIHNGLIEMGLNTDGKISKGIQAISRYRDVLKDISLQDELNATIDAIAQEEVTGPILPSVSLPVFQQTHCTRCGQELVIRFHGEGVEPTIGCPDMDCTLKFWDENLNLDIIKRAEEQAERENRTVTEFDYAFEKILDDFCCREFTSSPEHTRATKAFYSAYDTLVEKGPEFRKLANEFDNGLGLILSVQEEYAFRAGFMEGMKYAASQLGGAVEA